MTNPLDDFPKGPFALGVALGAAIVYFALELYDHGNGTLDAAEVAFGLIVSQRGSWIVIGPALYGLVAVAIACGESLYERFSMFLLAAAIHYGTVVAMFAIEQRSGTLASQFRSLGDASPAQIGFVCTFVGAQFIAGLACTMPLIDRWRFREYPRGW